MFKIEFNLDSSLIIRISNFAVDTHMQNKTQVLHLFLLTAFKPEQASSLVVTNVSLN